MIAVKKILVAIDFNDSARPVLDFGRTLADACGSSLHLLHVIAPRLSGPEVGADERHDVCRRLQALLDAGDRERRHATAACQVGTPAPEIARYAADNGIDLIVMGTHSHGPTFRMTTGSVAEAVIGLAPCAVLAVKGTAREYHHGVLDPPPAAARAS